MRYNCRDLFVTQQQHFLNTQTHFNQVLIAKTNNFTYY